MEKYKKHIFICENKREGNTEKGSCSEKGSLELKPLFKSKLKELGVLADIRPNSCGCLGACDFGSAIVVYPEQVWYGNVKPEDVDEIINEHLLNNKVVERLTIKDKRYNKDESRK